MVDGSQGQVAKVAALPSGPHCLHCHGDDDDDDDDEDDDLYRQDQGNDDDGDDDDHHSHSSPSTSPSPLLSPFKPSPFTASISPRQKR